MTDEATARREGATGVGRKPKEPPAKAERMRGEGPDSNGVRAALGAVRGGWAG